VTQHWRNSSGQIIRSAGSVVRCATCPCGGVDICDGGTFDGTLWQARLTTDFTSCTPPQSGQVSCDELNVTDQVCTWNGTLGSFDYGSGTDQARCNPQAFYFGFWYKQRYRVRPVCPTGGGGNGKIELMIRANSAAEFDALIAEITGLSTIETGTTYTLTPKANCGFAFSDCLCGWDSNPTVEFEEL
jgi:hypothetical protein